MPSSDLSIQRCALSRSGYSNIGTKQVNVGCLWGGVTLRGIRLCEPCGHLERVTGRPVREGLIHRGGLRAQILTAGTIQTGDAIELIEPK